MLNSFLPLTVMSLSMKSITDEGIVPDIIDQVPKAEINVKYPSGVSVKLGNEATPTQVKDQPDIKYNSKPNGLYSLFMIDPDAPSRTDPKMAQILHYQVVNIPGSDISKGDTAFEYVGAGPPQGTGLHRYIYLLYNQKDRIETPTTVPKTSREGRKNFNVRDWAKQHNLGQPIAVNFFKAQYDDYVPVLHKQLGM